MSEENKGLDGLPPEEYIKIIKELRHENATARVRNAETEKRLAEIEKQAEAERQSKLAEEGKIKELAESYKKELDNLAPVRELAGDAEKYFTARLEEKVKGLTDVEREMIEQSKASLPQRLDLVEKLLSQKTVLQNSPGGKPSKQALLDSTLDDFLKPENRERLHELYFTDKELYAKVIEAKKKREII